MADYTTQIAQIHLGHMLLALTALLYLAWWCLYFFPDFEAPRALKATGVVCILAAFACGVWAIVKILGACSQLPCVAPGWTIILGGIVIYVVAAFVTKGLLERPITTELFLIVGWLALELAVASALAASGGYSTVSVAVFIGIVLVAAVASLVCYNAYYHLDAWLSFFDGAGPLVAVGVASLAFALLL